MHLIHQFFSGNFISQDLPPKLWHIPKIILPKKQPKLLSPSLLVVLQLFYHGQDLDTEGVEGEPHHVEVVAWNSSLHETWDIVVKVHHDIG